MAARSQSDLGSKTLHTGAQPGASCKPKSQGILPKDFLFTHLPPGFWEVSRPRSRHLKEGNGKEQIFSASPFPKSKDCTYCVFCTWAQSVTAEQMLNGSNIPIAVQRNNQAEIFNDKQDKTVLKSNELSSQSLPKSDSNILMAFPWSHCADVSFLGK